MTVPSPTEPSKELAYSPHGGLHAPLLWDILSGVFLVFLPAMGTILVFGGLAYFLSGRSLSRCELLAGYTLDLVLLVPAFVGVFFAVGIYNQKRDFRLSYLAALTMTAALLNPSLLEVAVYHFFPAANHFNSIHNLFVDARMQSLYAGILASGLGFLGVLHALMYEGLKINLPTALLGELGGIFWVVFWYLSTR